MTLQYKTITFHKFIGTPGYACTLPYSKKLTQNDFNAKVINAEEINAVEELLLYFIIEINVVSTSGIQII